MANTYSQIYIHIIFAVKGRQNLIRKDFKDELYKFITGIIQHRNQKLFIINGMTDHIHIFIGLEPDVALSNIVRDIKAGSSKFINDKKFIQGKFNWQEGYGAFSYSKSQKQEVIKYIENQEEHHRKRSFKEEYFEFLNKFEIDYDEKYLFEFIE